MTTPTSTSTSTQPLHWEGASGYHHARGAYAAYAIDDWPGVAYVRVDISPENELALGGLPAGFRDADGLPTRDLDEAKAAAQALEDRLNLIASAPRLAYAH